MDKDIATWQCLVNKNSYCDQLRALFKEIDADHSELITIDEFEECLNNEHFQAYFAALELDPFDAWTLFKLLDLDESGQIEIDEFVTGCLHIKGEAKAIQLAKMDYETRETRRKLEQFMLRSDNQFRLIRNSLNIPSAARPSPHHKFKVSSVANA